MEVNKKGNLPMEDPTSPNSYTTAHVFIMVILSVVFLLGTTGNGLVIWFVVFKLKKTVNTVWFLSLAMADFTFSLFQPFEVTHFALKGHWPFGDFMCKLNSFVLMFNMFSSILQLTVISMDRCIIVIFPVWCHNHRTTRLAFKITLIIWILAAGFSIPFVIRKMTYTQKTGHVDCTEISYGASTSETKESIFVGRVIIRFIFFFVIPFIIIVSCYIVIVCRIRRRYIETSSKPFKIMTAVITSFLICWLPYHVFSYIWESALDYQDQYLFKVCYVGLPISTSLAYTNSCLNPFLYVFFGRDFKEKFWSGIQSALKRAFTDEYEGVDTERNKAQQHMAM